MIGAGTTAGAVGAAALASFGTWNSSIAVGVIAILITTVLAFGSGMNASSFSTSDTYLLGILFSGLALIGNSSCDALRKYTAKVTSVSPAMQVGLAALMQGIFGSYYCWHAGIVSADSLPTSTFFIAATLSSLVNSVTKTLQTKAYAEYDMSMCAPFLAFDPVMQFLVGTQVMPVVCQLSGLGDGFFAPLCKEPKKDIPMHHVGGVLMIATGALLIGFSNRAVPKPEEKAAKDKKDSESKPDPPAASLMQSLRSIPLGSYFIMFNCFCYGFTSRFDKLAIKSAHPTAGKNVYYAFTKLTISMTTLTVALRQSRLTLAELVQQLIAEPHAIGLILCTCVAEAVYMLSMYQAILYISPMYMTAIKRGGGLLVTSVLGVLYFGERMEGRFGPILIIVTGVVFLCLPFNPLALFL